jgi:HPt (histidine-containing phosphotransfer) domain-containing protein
VVDTGGPSNNESWIVEIDPDIADLVPGFLENRQRDIQKATEALAQSDFAALAMLGHTMKGAGAGYGFEEISVIGGAMEAAAKQADSQSVANSIERLKRYLERVEVRYE